MSSATVLLHTMHFCICSFYSNGLTFLLIFETKVLVQNWMVHGTLLFLLFFLLKKFAVHFHHCHPLLFSCWNFVWFPCGNICSYSIATLKRIVLPMPTETPPCYDLRCGILFSCILWFHYTCIPAHFQRPFFFVLIAFEPIFQSVVTDFVYSHFFLFFLVYSHCTIIPIFYCNLSALFPTLFCFRFVSFYTFCIQFYSVSMHI